jgi:uncharacterized protein (DUF1697 family)
MTTWVALFRGINVGGNNILPMAELRQELESLNLKNVRTYIQSGNVIFDSTTRSASSLAKKIAALIKKEHGFQPQVLLLTVEELLAAITLNPFPEAKDEPKTINLFFLASPATNADLEAVDKAKISTERYKLTKHVFYLHAPDGTGRSKLASNVEKYLGVVTTARNYRTVDKIRSMVAEPIQ